MWSRRPPRTRRAGDAPAGARAGRHRPGPDDAGDGRLGIPRRAARGPAARRHPAAGDVGRPEREGARDRRRRLRPQADRLPRAAAPAAGRRRPGGASTAWRRPIGWPRSGRSPPASRTRSTTRSPTSSRTCRRWPSGSPPRATRRCATCRRSWPTRFEGAERIRRLVKQVQMVSPGQHAERLADVALRDAAADGAGAHREPDSSTGRASCARSSPTSTCAATTSASSSCSSTCC